MSTAAPAKPAPQADREIRIYGHTKLFYWWPVWLSAFIFAAMTFVGGERLAIVPSNTQIKDNKDGTYTINANAGSHGSKELERAAARETLGQTPAFKVRVSSSQSIGAVFVIILLLVTVITNV